MSNTNNVNVPVSTNSFQLNPHDHINKGINEIITEYLSLISPEKKRSMKTLFFGVTVLITADIAKNIIQNFIKENSQNINSFLMSGLKLISFENLYNISIYTKNKIESKYYYFKNLFVKKESLLYNNEELITTNNFKKIDLIFSNILLKKTITVLEENNDENLKISYKTDYSFKTICINEDSNKLIYGKMIEDINIKYDKLNIYIDKLIYTSDYSKIITNNIMSLLDILSREYPDFTNKGLYDIILLPSVPLNILSIKHNYNNEQYFVNTDSYPIKEYPCIKMHINIQGHNSYADILLTKAFEGYTYDAFLKYLSNNTKLLNTILINITALYVIELTTCILKSNCFKLSMSKILDNQIYYSYSKDLSCFDKFNYLKHVNDDCTLYDKITRIIDYQNYESFLIYKNIVNFNHSINTEKKTNDVSDKITLTLNLSYDQSNETIFDTSKIYSKLNDFFNYINSASKLITNGEKINIYTLNIDSKTLKEKSDNEEYAKYIETKRSLVEEKKSSEDIIKLIGVEPQKYIETITTIKEIKKNLINNKYCSFENLYLRRGQDISLYNIVESFQNDKSLMTELGIPNKLGILLYGEPGCGKTTTIITIASFFKRDIFYINLKAIKTNEELKMAFDYAISKHTDGGIIVIEDIDAMSDIVHVRTSPMETNDSSMNTLLESTESDITLEYLLNLLDGTLTYDNSIVILTTNHIKNLDPALYRAGRMDNLIEMKKSDHYQISKIYKRFIQRDLDKDILNKIPEDKYTPAQIIFHLKLWVKRRNEPDHIIMNEFMI